MEAILDDDKFSGFGPDELLPRRQADLNRVAADTPGQLRELVRSAAPRCPGVYGMLDATGQLIYVGKSKALRNRLISYFLPSNEEDKSGRIVQSTVAIVWEEQPSEFAALLREQHLIRTFQPRFNVQGITRRRQPVYICLGRKPAEQFYTSRKHEPTALSCVGPLAGAGKAARAVEVLNRLYHLRDCSNSQPCGFAEQLQLFDLQLRPGCIRHEIGTCLGPCISACTRREYQAQVEAAQRFLSAADPWPVVELRQRLGQAIERLQFEQAASLREDWLAVGWLQRKLEELEDARLRYTFIYELDPRRETTARPRAPVFWYLIRHGCVEACVPKPRSAHRRAGLLESIHRWLSGSANVPFPVRHRPETLPLVASWFRNRRQELAHTLTLDGPVDPARAAVP
ncbi:MAG: ethanolamine utilization protein [Pirellulaceae bacterium]|nr:MAG: ethanolamine utilization protein [Pirellulaceae bacterium]